jgi:hypothetical protein
MRLYTAFGLDIAPFWTPAAGGRLCLTCARHIAISAKPGQLRPYGSLRFRRFMVSRLGFEPRTLALKGLVKVSRINVLYSSLVQYAPRNYNNLQRPVLYRTGRRKSSLVAAR